MSRALVAGLVVLALGVSACRDGAKSSETAAPDAPPATSASPASPDRVSALHLGAPIEQGTPAVALSDLAKNPGAWSGKAFTTEGTVSAVCQHMGCWMEIKDDSGQAHVKMAGHNFFVPKTAAGHKARVLATLEAADPADPSAEEAPGSCAGEGEHAANGAPSSCRAEAEKQMGHSLSNLELVADGVELM